MLSSHGDDTHDLLAINGNGHGSGTFITQPEMLQDSRSLVRGVKVTVRQLGTSTLHPEKPALPEMHEARCALRVGTFF